MWHLKTRRPKQWVCDPLKRIVERGAREGEKGNERRHSEINGKTKRRTQKYTAPNSSKREEGSTTITGKANQKLTHHIDRTALCLPRFLSIMLYRFVLSSPFDNKSSAFETVFLSSFHRSIRLLAGWLDSLVRWLSGCAHRCSHSITSL